MAKLFVLTGDDLGRTFELGEGGVLGRGVDVDFRLRGSGVSRRHARLAFDGGHWWIEDLGSRNGVQIGGRKHARARLENGTVFVLGDLELRFRDEGGEAETAGAATLVDEDASAGSAAASTGASADVAPKRASEAAGAPSRREPARSASSDAASADEDPQPPLGHAPPAEEAIEFDDEFELEGEWNEDATVRVSPQAPRPSHSSRARAERSVGADTTANEQKAKARGSAQARAAALGAKAPRGERATTSGGRILQYSATTDTGAGLLRGDLDQQPLWVKFVIVLLLLGVMGALGYGAFTLTRTTRENRASTPGEVEFEGEG